MAVEFRGDAWLRIFLISLIFVAPLLLVLGLVLHRFDRVEFDDAARLIRQPLRYPVSYDSVTGICVGEVSSLLSLLMGRREPRLFVSVASNDIERLRRTISTRWNDEMLAHSQVRMRWWILAVVGLHLVIGEARVQRLERTHASVKQPCAAVNWKMDSVGRRSHRFGSFLFTAPPGFTERPGERGLHGPMFHSNGATVFYAEGPMGSPTPFDALPARLFRAALRHGLGLDNGADVLRFTTCATNGLARLAIRSRQFGGDDVKRLAFDGGVAVVRKSLDTESEGTEGYTWLADVFLGHDSEDLRVGVRANQLIDNELLEEIVSRVEYAPQQD